MIDHNREKKHQELESEITGGFATDVLAGLSSPRKYLASKYFYDKAGSQLFEQISAEPEYYLTRVEASILRENSGKIASTLVENTGISVVELGSGSSTKTRILLEEFEKLTEKSCYFPIDISHEMLMESTRALKSDFPLVKTIGIHSDYAAGLDEVNRLTGEDPSIPPRKLILFLGSSIGNFEATQSVSFLRMIRQKMSRKDRVLVGFDLQKDREIINAAYNDRSGVTAKFNLNLLERMNRELDADFVLERFSHRAFYNEELKRVEMHLVSLADQRVHIGRIAKTFAFKKNETIHTENSYKYSMHQIHQMASQSGLKVQSDYRDKEGWFTLSLFRPAD
jgi:dimethylhistidine N-methyltransferase